LRILHRHLEEPEQRGQRRLEGFIECLKPPDHLVPDLPRVVPILDLKVALEQVGDRQIRTGDSVRDAIGAEHSPPPQSIRTRQLIDETRFPDPRLPNDSHQLSLPAFDLRESIVQKSELPFATNERTQRSPAEPKPGLFSPRQPIRPAGQCACASRGHQLEPPFEKRRSGVADQDCVRVLETHEPFQDRRGGALSFQIDLAASAELADKKVLNVNRRSDAGHCKDVA
jgi:hypothetical protein